MTGGGPLLVIQLGQNGIGLVGNGHWRESTLQFLPIKPNRASTVRHAPVDGNRHPPAGTV